VHALALAIVPRLKIKRILNLLAFSEIDFQKSLGPPQMKRARWRVQIPWENLGNDNRNLEFG
jgi:hypothetical protein